MDLKLTITRGEQGFSLAYALGDKKIEGANVRFLSAVGELDAASAMAVETEGKFEMIRGEIVRPQVSLFTWKGAEKHLGLYPESPYFLRYSKGTTVQLSLFSPMEDEHKLSFKLRLNFAEDKSAMDNAFKQAYALRDGGQMGESCRAFKQIIRRYPFIDGSSKARKSIERIEQEAVRELAKLRQGFVRGQHFNRSKMLMGVREDLMAYQKRFEGMAVLAQSKELTEQVKNALTSAKSREVEALANQLMQKAKDFREAQMNNLAITVYKRVIEQCAGTSQAEDAAKAIQELLPAEKGN